MKNKNKNDCPYMHFTHRMIFFLWVNWSAKASMQVFTAIVGFLSASQLIQIGMLQSLIDSFIHYTDLRSQ